MAIGPTVRALFGPLEPRIADLYRAMFFSVNALAREIHRWAPAASILEVGCGEGALIQRVAELYPTSLITGIDITPRVGRLYRGDRKRVSFHEATIHEFSDERRDARFDLVILCDLLHHVPLRMHPVLLRASRNVMRSGGRFVLKDWESRFNIISFLAYCSDRVLTGDQVRYSKHNELREVICDVFGPNSIERELRLPPWRNNVAFFVRQGAPGT